MLGRILILALLLAASLPGSALAHPEGQSPLRSDILQVGPYTLTIEYNTWPVRQHASLEMIIKPSGGLAGKRAWLRITPEAEFRSSIPMSQLRTYPGVEDGWVIHLVEPFPAGQRLMEFKVSGPEGEAIGRYTGYQVAEPPLLPLWAGWLIGLTPLYGLVWFGYREYRRVRRLMVSDGGARAA